MYMGDSISEDTELGKNGEIEFQRTGFYMETDHGCTKYLKKVLSVYGF